MEAEIALAVKSFQQKLWERGQEEAILRYGYAHLAKSPNVDNRQGRKVVGKRGRSKMEVWEQGDDGIWRQVQF